MPNKINYYEQSLETIKNIPNNGIKPTLLLHACCGPCSTFPLTFLCPIFDVTIYFNNSNIFPSEEYYRRLDELKKFVEKFNKDYGFDVKIIETKYENDKYNLDLEKYADEPEGKTRCLICYEKRMNEAFDFANKNGFDFFTTVMTISRQKSSEILNKIGEKLQKNYAKTQYFYSDFKKNRGIDQGHLLTEFYGLYQQLYCGCKFTYKKGLEIAKKREGK